MKAIVYREYGPPDVLHVEEVPTPTPKEDEVLIRVRAAAVNYGDLTGRNFKNLSPGEFNMPTPLWFPARLSFGLNKPRKRILGSEFAGEVEAVGSGVTQFTPGEPVFGYRGQSMGANAEYLAMSAGAAVTRKPSNMTYEEAATVPYGAMTALSLLRKADLQPGQKALINGASGAIGSYALQLARHAGAEVTGVCSTPRVAFVKALGADHVIDYTQQDFTQNGETYDLIFDVLGRSSFERCKQSLTPTGRYLLASFKTKQLLQMLRTSRSSGKKVICALSSENPKALVTVRDLVEAGAIKTVVDRCFPMDQAAEAHRYVEAGNKQGHVVITF